MKGKMKKKGIAGLIVIAAIAMVVIFAGCVGSPYHVEYSIDGGYGRLQLFGLRPQLLVNVSGPADDLAIILTDPEENTHIAYISKNEMIDNFEGVRISMCKGGTPPDGTYKLVVKTVTPEKVVYKTEAKFTPADVHITDAYVKLEPCRGFALRSCYYRVVGYSITAKNDGELPVTIDEIIIFLPPSPSLWGVGIDDEYISDTTHWYVSYGENKVEEDYYNEFLSPQIMDVPTQVTIELYSEEELIASFEAYTMVEY